MKLKNILFSLLAVLVSFFGTTVKAATTTAPESYGIRYSDMHEIHGWNYLTNYDLTFRYKVNTDGKIVYCLDYNKMWPTGEPTMYYRGDVISAKYAYILANGYPNVTMTGDKDQDYFITGMAIWYIADPDNRIFRNLDMENGTYWGSANESVQWMSKLVKGANSYSYVNPTITINNSNSNMTLSSDKKYYESTLSVKTTGTVGNYTVSLSNAPSGTIVTDKNGTTKNTFAPSESFMVKVPVSSIKELSNSFTVKVSAEGSVNKAYVYSTKDSSIQRTIGLYPEKDNISNTTTLKIDITTRVEVSKVDATTGTELPGAKLTVLDANKKVVDSWTSTTEIHVIKNLKPGKYTLIEEIAPEGYELSKEEVEFEVKADGSVTKVKMENKPTEKIVYISKIDAKTGERLAGAKLVIQDSKGKEVVKPWVSTDKPHTVKGLKPGKYKLVELSAPKGYILNTKGVEFEITKKTKSIEVKMENTPEEPKVIYISKQDVTTGEELPGAKLELRNENNELVEAWVSTNEPHKIKGLAPGKYYLTEVLAPEGYELSTETIEFVVKEDGTVDGKIVMYNKPETIVPVPITSSFKTITTSLIGLIILGLGSIVIYRNYKKNNG